MNPSLDVYDYHRLPLSMRDEVDEWLRRAGGEPHNTFCVTVVGEGVGEAGVYVRDADGKRILRDDLLHGPGHPVQSAPERCVTTKQTLVLSEPPPWWRL